jgi:hypothetical protein
LGFGYWFGYWKLVNWLFHQWKKNDRADMGEITNDQDTITKQISKPNNQLPNMHSIGDWNLFYWLLFGYWKLELGYFTNVFV